MADGLSRLPLQLKVVSDDDDDDTNHKFPSSVHKVLSNDDLLMEILLRLPMLSLHLFKPVCKQWLSLITSQTFPLTRTRIDPPCGLFIERRCPNEYDFLSFDPRIPSKRSILFSFKSKVQIIQSCNGLLLCYIGDDKYCVCNPLINMFKMLPPMHDLNYEMNGTDQMYMAFDPTKSPCYQVIYAGSVYVDDEDDDDEFYHRIRIQTYSSETGVWSVSDDPFPCECFSICDGIYWNGAIHLLNYFKPFHVKLDIVNRPVLTNIQTPLPLTIDGKVHSYHKLFNSHGSLLLLCMENACSRHFEIYEMKIGNAEWLVKYFVNLDDMMKPYPTWRMPTKWSCRDILSIVLGERDEDSFMVIELSGKVLQYKFWLGSASELFDFGEAINRFNYSIGYSASFAHV